jgi:hypothetical protein
MVLGKNNSHNTPNKHFRSRLGTIETMTAKSNGSKAKKTFQFKKVKRVGVV